MKENSQELDASLNKHYVHRTNCLRALFLEANNSVLSTVISAIGDATTSNFRAPVILEILAGAGRCFINSRQSIRFGRFSDRR
jgi:hypothetical protein